MAFALTPEQHTIRDAFTTTADLVVQAGAGAGKTSTLMELAKAQPDRRGIYIAYNRAIKEAAAASFPKSVRCMTSHGIAYGAVGKNYRHRLNMPRQNGRVVAKILGVTQPVKIGDGLPMIAPMQIARMAKETVGRFCNSADPNVSHHHVPRRQGHTPEQWKALAKAVLPFALKAWADITNTDGALRFEHDHYLKLWALTNPRLRYDYLLFDEAQDANRMLTALVLHQTHAQRIAVGDSAQAIYGWRGAEDALSVFPGQQLTLSQSFRFGPAIANQANIWLDLIDAPLRLTGFDKIDSTVGTIARPKAILTRTNAGAMAEAMAMMKTRLRVAIVGGGGAMEALAMAAIDLKAGRPTDHPELIAFANWAQVEDYAENEADGADLRPLVNLIEEHGPDEIIRTARMLSDEKRAEVIVSTAHKAKGLEWDSVRIGDDFKDSEPRPDKEGRQFLKRAEAMLCYVAVTRAKLALDCTALNWVHRITGIA